MSKIALITGITGMDAEALCDILLSKSYTVVGTYRKTAGLNLDAIAAAHRNNPNLYLEFCDIADHQSVETLVLSVLEKHGRIDELYLLAAQSHVGLSFTSAESTVQTDGMSVFYFLETLRQHSPKTRTYFAATSELLGGDPAGCPFNEDSPFDCRSPYAVAKELGTRWVRYYQQMGLFATYGLLFNHSNTSRNLSFYIRRVTNGAARIALGKQKTLPLGSLDFYRDEHWSDFGCEMMWKMLQLDRPETFVICRGECFHGEQFLDEAFGYFNLRWQDHVTLDKERLRPNEVVKLLGDPSRAVEKLGWQPDRMSFGEHIELMCRHDFALERGEKPGRPNVFTQSYAQVDLREIGL
jgi:GDPmannose 4,6-dehydratase